VLPRDCKTEILHNRSGAAHPQQTLYIKLRMTEKEPARLAQERNTGYTSSHNTPQENSSVSVLCVGNWLKTITCHRHTAQHRHTTAGSYLSQSLGQAPSSTPDRRPGPEDEQLHDVLDPVPALRGQEAQVPHQGVVDRVAPHGGGHAHAGQDRAVRIHLYSPIVQR
jgi:hypothetical protein